MNKAKKIAMALLAACLILTGVMPSFIQTPVYAVTANDGASEDNGHHTSKSTASKSKGSIGWKEIGFQIEPKVTIDTDDGPKAIKLPAITFQKYASPSQYKVSGPTSNITRNISVEQMENAIQTQILTNPNISGEEKKAYEQFAYNYAHRDDPGAPVVTYYGNAVMTYNVHATGKDAGSLTVNPKTGKVTMTGLTYQLRDQKQRQAIYSKFGNNPELQTYADKDYSNDDETEREKSTTTENPSEGDVDPGISTTPANPEWTVTQIGEGTTGSLTPLFYAFHDSATYDVGAGIPSGQSMTAGSAADRWYGTYTWKKWKAETTTPYQYVFHLSGTYTVRVNHPIHHGATYSTTYDQYGNVEQISLIRGPWDEDHWVDEPRTTSRDILVDCSRSVEFYSISSAEFYQYTASDITNDSYGKTTIQGTSSVNGTLTVNGNPQTAYSDNYGMVLESHLSVDTSNTQQSIGGLTLEKSLGEYSADDLISRYGLKEKTAGAFVATVKNDALTVNGKQYLTEDQRKTDTSSYDASQVTVAANTTPLAINSSDYHASGYDIGQTTVNIPQSTLNEKYTTTITAKYIRRVPSDNNPTYHTGTGTNYIWTGGGSHNGTYKSHEPVVIHTPVEAYIKHIYSSDGSKSATEASPTQLAVKPSSTINGQEMNNLLLDGTYTIKFDATKWLSEKTKEDWPYSSETNKDRDGNITGDGGSSIPGIDNGSGTAWNENVLNSYVQEKVVRFPFDVAVIDTDGTKKYYLINSGDDYTDWITIPNDGCRFYIPTWAEESTTKFKTNGDENGVYKIQFKVEAWNTNDNYDSTERLMNSKLPKYVATFDVPVNVSGVIYGFQIIGTNDKDMYDGYGGDASDQMDYSFVMNKEEKKAGTRNRLGQNTVRTTLDGTPTTWNKHNVIPMRNGTSSLAGTSNAYNGMGAFWKGTTFSFSVKTIANLSDDDDKVVIKPTFRYYPGTGSNPGQEQDVKIYYSDENGEYIEVGSKEDKGNVKTVQLGNKQFEGSWYEGNKFLSLAGDSVGYTIPNHMQDTLNNNGLSEDVFLNQKNKSYSMSSIVLDKNLRIISGDEEELTENITKARNDGSYKTIDQLLDGIGDEEKEEFTNSMQTWYGQYTIPNNLFVTYTKIDINGDGTKATLGAKNGETGYNSGDDIDGDGEITLKDYAYAHKLSDDSSIWLKTGYLVLNFDIETVNDGVEHLLYDGGNTDDGGMWKTEDQLTGNIAVERQDSTTSVTNPTNGNPGYSTFNLNLKYGDIALVDLRYSQNDKYSAHIFMTN